jgi:hypothetical protein
MLQVWIPSLHHSHLSGISRKGLLHSMRMK